MKKDTSWENSADWYNDLLEDRSGTYQKDVILPNLLRLMQIQKNQLILDLACGQGFFSKAYANAGAKVVGVDISKTLIDLAKKNSPRVIEYHVGPADDLKFTKDQSVDSISLILAIQNIENVSAMLKECSRVLKDGGKMFIVMNHPAFRIPKESEWGFDVKKKIQYRRIDQYLTEAKTKIEMHPGEKESEYTISFHRPLQYYFKLLNNNGFVVSRLEEWISNKKSGSGHRQVAEDRIRKEIPLFLFLEVMKVKFSGFS